MATEARLPPHTAEVLALFAAAECCDSLFWRVDPGGAIAFLAECSDTFLWATADAEVIEPGDADLLRRCYDDLRECGEDYHLAELFAARKRGHRPMDRWMPACDTESARALFEAAGPPMVDPLTQAFASRAGADGNDENGGAADG